MKKVLILLEVEPERLNTITHFIKGLKGCEIAGKAIGAKIVVEPIKNYNTKSE